MKHAVRSAILGLAAVCALAIPDAVTAAGRQHHRMHKLRET